MSDEGEKTCPLCAEEMDLTDQQLKPCKCGYDICVWCWHHIMDMAEKDETEGRCPACRSPYNKEKIVGTAAKCERLVSEMNVEKKLKLQKGKSKTSEGRKQLGSVRVIQRNLVYVVGLPLNLADEDLLQHREYFGQYGKVLKVSISRTTTGAIQQFANSTCSVYITYSKEEEAVRCIQLVHGFVLDGRPLRACFGTTKYCHAWLRNVPCSNADCLYLHEVGSQEDSFTKDEIISAYTRSRIQQVTSASISTQRRSGNFLPPLEDEYCNNSSVPSGKPIIKSAINTNNSATNARISPPNSSSGRSTALPAGASCNQLLSESTPCSNGPSIKKPDMRNGQEASSKAVASQVSSYKSDTGHKKVLNDENSLCQEKSGMDTYEIVKKELKADGRVGVPDSSKASTHLPSLPSTSQPCSPPTTEPLLDTTNVVNSSATSSGTSSNKDFVADIDGDMENVSSDILAMSIQENHQLENGYIEHIREPLSRQTSGKAANTTEESCTATVQSDFRLGMPSQATQGYLHELEDDLLTFDSQRIKDPEIASNRAPEFSNAFNFKHSNISSPAFDNADGLIGMGLDRRAVDRNSLMIPTSKFPSSRPENLFYNSEGNGAEDSNFFSNNEKRSLLGRYEAEVGGGVVNVGESSLISNILSMDFDPWNESLTSPQNLAKFLGGTDRRQGSLGATGSWKPQNSSQSRFSFAREEEPRSFVSGFRQSINYNEQAFQQRPFAHDVSGGGSRLHFENSGGSNALPVFGGTEPDYFASNRSNLPSNKLSVSKTQVSAPPGFSAPSRAPPGFTSHERTDQNFESLPGNHMLDASTLSRNHYQTPLSGSTFSNGDVEFIDPAILAVGKGTVAGGINNPGLDIRSSFSPQFSTYDDARFQSLLQRSLPPHQNQRFTHSGDNFSALGDAYGIPSRIVEQTLSNNVSPYSQFTLSQSRNGIASNGPWDGWNEAHLGNSLGMAELLRTERLGLNKFYGGYEEPKIPMPSSGNLYNGGYGM